ncbi:MAG: DNA import protein CedA1 [Fervidicoccaceae archaeon]
MTLVEFVNNVATQVALLAWALFALTWSIGWVLRGSPLPVARLKRAGQSLIEDALWAAFWLAMGSTVFSVISYLVQVVAIEISPS